MFERTKERLAQRKAAAAAAAATAAAQAVAAASDDGPPNGIILWHYTTSPVARRVVWYLKLSGLEYGECMQPMIKPRPDVESLGVNYRRVPLLSIGRDVYCDSRLILRKLSALVAAAPPAKNLLSEVPRTVEAESLVGLFSIWTQQGGVFMRAAGLIPPESPVFKNEKFLKDREGFSGGSWRVESVKRARPENLVAIKEAFSLAEGLMRDGREWVLGTKGPSLGDIEAIWPFHWLLDMGTALPPNYISEKDFPKTYAWISRFQAVLDGASKTAPAPAKLKGPEAVSFVLQSEYAEPAGGTDPRDPLGLTVGETVEVYPTDSGFGYKDRGLLVSLTPEEVTIAVKAKDSEREVRVHMPRTGFRVAKAVGGGNGGSKL